MELSKREQNGTSTAIFGEECRTDAVCNPDRFVAGVDELTCAEIRAKLRRPRSLYAAFNVPGDNMSVYKTKHVDAFSGSHGNVHMRLTPTYPSC